MWWLAPLISALASLARTTKRSLVSKTTKQKSTSVMNYHTNFKVYLIADQTQGLKHEQLVSALSVTALLATILLLKLTN